MSVVRCLSAAAESLMAQDVGVTIGAESGVLARWLLVAAFGRITVGKTVIILHGLAHGTLAAWSFLFSGMKIEYFVAAKPIYWIPRLRNSLTENLADECLYFSSLTVVPEVETSDPTECEFVHSHTGYRWDPSTMLSGTAFHGPSGQTHAITKDCWAGAGVFTLLRVIAAGGWDDASLARWLPITRRLLQHLPFVPMPMSTWNFRILPCC